MPSDIGSVELFMGPSSLGGQDDLEATIISFIERARKTLDIAVQELESKPIALAILAARSAGMRVRVVLESHYLTVITAVADPWVLGGTNAANREIFAALLRGKVGVRMDLNSETFHQKFIVRDSDGTRAAVLTGSTNFTPTGTNENLNHIVIIKGKRTSGVYQDEFDEIWTGTFGVKQERHDPAPRTYRVSKIRVKALFAPDHAPEMEIMKQMLKARKRVDFAMFTFAQSSGIDDAMMALSRGAIPVRGILDRMQANQKWAATRPLMNAGAELHILRGDTGVNKLHHKLMVIDKQVIIVGSFNYTGPANALNDENIVVIGDVSESDPEAVANQKQLARYALAEIDRMISDHGVPVLQ